MPREEVSRGRGGAFGVVGWYCKTLENVREEGLEELSSLKLPHVGITQGMDRTFGHAGIVVML